MSRTSREWRSSDRFNKEAQDASLSDGSQDQSGSSCGLEEGSQEARDEYCLYGANEPGKDESSLSVLELFNEMAQKTASAHKPQQTQVPVQTQGPIKARRITDSVLKEAKTSVQTPVSKPPERSAFTDESKKGPQLDRTSAKLAEAGAQKTEPFLAEDDFVQPQDSQKKRVESKLKRINSKESIGSKKSTTSKRSKANSKRGSGSGFPKMTLLSDVMKRNEGRICNSIPSLHQIETDRPSKTQDSNMGSMPLVLTNLINQAVSNSSSLKQKTEHLANKDLANQMWSDRRSPHRALKQNLAIASETLSKLTQTNPPEASTCLSSNLKTRAVALNLAKLFSQSTTQPNQDATLTTSQVNTVSNEQQPILNTTLLKSKILSGEKKTWFNSNQKSATDQKKPSSIFDSLLLNADKKDRTPQEDQETKSPDSQLQQSGVLDRRQSSGIKHMIEGLKNQPNRLRLEVQPKKPDKEEKDGKPKPKKQLDCAQKLSILALNLQSAVEN